MSILVSALVVLLALNGLMFLAQPRMVFFPQSQLDGKPTDWGLEYQEVHFKAEDGVKLHGWLVPHRDSTQALLFFHGNAGNISHRGESVALFHRLGINVFIVDYRGYGRSGGNPSEQGLYLDAEAAWRVLVRDLGFAPADIVLFGRSLGGVVAAKLASVEQPGALILESTLSSAADAARALYPLLSRLVVLKRFDLDAQRYVQSVRCPVLVLHSPQDEVIPYRLGRKLFEAAAEPKRFFDLTGGHNEGFLLSQPAYGQAISEFLQSYKGLEAT